MLDVEFTGRFRKDYKLALKRGCDAKKLQEVITLLANEKLLPEKYRDHALENSHNYQNVRECHITSDWLLIYKIYSDRLVLELIRTGTHSDLF